MEIPGSVALAWDPSRQPSQVTAGAFAHDAVEAAAPRVDIVETIGGLTALEAEWDRLYQHSDPLNPFLGHAWTLACWRAQQGNPRPFVLTLRDGDRLIAVAPMCIERRAGFRVLRFIADDRSDYLGFLLAAAVPGLEQRLVDALVETSSNWDLAIFRQITAEYCGLTRAALPASIAAHDVKWTAAPYCAFDGDWDSLHLSGPTWLKRTRKRLPRFLKDGWSIEPFSGDEAAKRLDEVAAIEARSWKGAKGATRLQPGAGQELLRHAFHHDSACQMELWLASLDGKPVAFQLDFRLPDRLWVYQQAYDEDYRRTSVGSFMAYLSFEAAWATGVREYDYLSGEEGYKMERTNASRGIHHLALHRRTAQGWLAYGLLAAPRWRLRDVPALRWTYKMLRSVSDRIRTRSNG